MNAGAMRQFLAVLNDAADHHDPSKPEVTHDLNLLAAKATPAFSASGVLGSLLNNPLVVSALIAWVTSTIEKLTAPKPPVVVDPRPPLSAPAPGPWTTIPPPAPALFPSALSFDIDLFDNENKPCGFRVEDKGDYYQLVKTDGTDNMPIHGRAYLHAGYYDDAGLPINFEERGTPHLYGTAQWFAREVGGKGRISELRCEPGAKDTYVQVDKGDRIVNWNNEAELPKEARRTGGMDVALKFPPEADESVFDVGFYVDTPSGRVETKPVRWAKVS